jgi:hypothetical protein
VASGDWRCAAGAWRECDSSSWNTQNGIRVVLSSPGALGWTPWVDHTKGHLGLSAMEMSAGGVGKRTFYRFDNA